MYTFQVILLTAKFCLAEPEPKPTVDPNFLRVVKKSTSYFPGLYVPQLPPFVISTAAALRSYSPYSSRYPLYPFGRNYLPPPFYNHPALFNRALPYHSPQMLYGGPYPRFTPNPLIGLAEAPYIWGEWAFADAFVESYPATYPHFFGWNSGAANPLPNAYHPHYPLNLVNKISTSNEEDDSYNKPSFKQYGGDKDYDHYKPYDKSSFLTTATAFENRHVLGKAKDSDYKTED